MSRSHYSKTLRIRVAQEAARPENNGMEHVIAAKYDLRPGTVIKWRDLYLQFGEAALTTGRLTQIQKTPREVELEKQVAELEEEVKILKKAAAFLVNVKHE